VLVLLIWIYDVRHRDGLMWKDAYIPRRLVLASKRRLRNLTGCNVGTAEVRDLPKNYTAEMSPGAMKYNIPGSTKTDLGNQKLLTE
jgi:hypothetical protein